MIFSRYASVSSLAMLCRVLRHSLGAGLKVADVFRQQSTRTPSELKPLCARVARQLERGKSLTSALRKEITLPPLFLALVEVGEESGQLAEVFEALEQYYTLQQQIQRRFRASTILPVLQFTGAVLIVAVVIWLLGAFTGGRSGVFGLSGTSGAVIFLAATLGVVLVLILGGVFLFQRLRGKYMLDALLLRLPLIGPCVRSLALARFTLALNLTLESSMLITRAIRLSLQATGNAAFEAATDAVEKELRRGEPLNRALTGTGVFPEDFRHILAVAEESGRVPEVMRQQCRHYQEEGERQVKGLTQAATWLVWLAYAIFMVVMIFQLAGIYFQALPK